MIRLLLLCIALSLSACSPRYQLVADLKPAIPLQPPIYSHQVATLIINDKRPDPAVITFHQGDSEVAHVENMVTIRQLISGKISELFQMQGLEIAKEAPAKLIVDIDELLVTLNRKGLIYEAVAKTGLQVAVVDDTRSLRKRFTREASQVFPLRPSLDQLSTMLDLQLEEVFQATAHDTDIRGALFAQNR